MSIDVVIGWKFNHQPGMRCKEIEGVIQIIEFPGGIPSKADQDTWIAEYQDWIDSGGEKEAEADLMLDLKKLIMAKAAVDYVSIPSLKNKYATEDDYLKAIRDAYGDSLS